MKPDSSTSSSELTDIDPNWVLALTKFVTKLVVVIAFLSIFEMAAYMFSPVVHPLQVPSDNKQRTYEQVVNNKDYYDAFMIGSSMTQSAFDPDIFDPIFGGHSFNAGIAGRSNTTWQLEMFNEITTRNSPKLVIYGIESWSLSAAPHQPTLPGTQMFRFLKLYQNRDQILNWLKKLSRGHPTRPPMFIAPDDQIWRQDKRMQFLNGQALHASGFLDVDAVGRPDFEGVAGPFKVLPEQARALETMMKTARASGIELVFVQLPEYVGEIERWRERHEAFRAYMIENVVAKGFTYLDFNFELAFPRERIELFYDVNHLNGTGARLFSADFAGQMKKRHNFVQKAR